MDIFHEVAKILDGTRRMDWNSLRRQTPPSAGSKMINNISPRYTCHYHHRDCFLLYYIALLFVVCIMMKAEQLR